MTKLFNYPLLFISIFFSNVCFAQSTGDFRSKTDGDWSSTATWEIFDGAVWNNAASLPNSSTSVYIQDEDSIVLTANAACKDLHLNSDITQGDVGRINTQTFTLSVNGKIRAYTAAKNTIPGTATSNAHNASAFITTGSGGKIQFVGTTRDVFVSGEWASPTNNFGWSLEFAMNSATDTAKINTNLRAGSITIASGVVQQVSGGPKPDNGSAGTGTFTINSGATYITTATGLFRTATDRFATFTLNAGGSYVIPSSFSASPVLAASTVVLSGTVVTNNGFFPSASGISGAATINTYDNVTINAATTLSSDITVNNTLTLNAKLTSSSSAKPIIGASGTISGASSSNFVDGPLVMTVAATSKTLNFEIGKGTAYRRVVLNLSHDAATSTQYTAEVFNSAPTSRTFPSGVTNVSNTRFWTITKGAGANVVATTTATFKYDTDDGVADHSSIQILKDDGAGNWVSLGTGGTAQLSGTITTSNFTSFSDFVIGNVNWVQNGDFRSLTSGNWSSTATWETYNSTSATWVAASSVPTSSNHVYIQDGDSVVLTANAACKDLHLNSDITQGDVGRINTQTFTLSINGRLRAYTGAKTNIPGATVSNAHNSSAFITTGSGGKIQFVGTTRDVFVSGEWASPTNNFGWSLEFAMNSATDTAKINTNLRAGSITIASGVVQQVSGGPKPDNGSAGTGTFTINSGATYITTATGLFRTATDRFATFTLNAGGSYVIPSSFSASPVLAASTVVLSGTVVTNNGFFPSASGISGAATINTYDNVTINAATTLSSDITVNNTLTLNAKLTSSSSAKPIIGASGTISGASSSSFVNGPLVMTVAATSKTLNFEIGKGTAYRRVVLNLSHDAATSTQYTAEVFNSAPTSRTFPSGVTNVSNTRFWTITKGAGANVVATTTATFKYDTDDGVADHSSIQILKDDGAGNWVSLGTGGTAQLSGTITTSNFTSFSDFVIGNVNWVQNGDFRSLTSGNWSSTATWETYNSTSATWVAASSVPTSSNHVYIQDGDSVVLTANAACKDLHLNSDITQGDVGRINTQTFTLSINGRLRAYTGAKTNIPGATVSNAHNSSAFITTGSGGKIQFVGTTRDVFVSGEWASPTNNFGWSLEFAMNSATDTAKINTNLRAGSITIASGVVQQVSGGPKPDNGSAGTGTFTINSGATYITTATGLFRTATDRFATFTLNAGGSYVIPSSFSASPTLAASTVVLSGTVVTNNGFFPSANGISGGATINTYDNVTINAATTLSSDITVNNTLTLNAKLTSSSSAKPIIGASGTISGASSSNFVDGPLAMTVAQSSLKSLTFEIGKGTTYRQLALNVTHSSATSTVYTAEVFNSAPTSRTIPSGITHISSIRHYNVSKGAGASVSSATIALNFDTDDLVNQSSSLRVVKDDGAGNWVNIGNTFVSGVPTGFIVSGSFTSFSDFVLGNASGGTNPLPVEWLSFEAVKINENTNILKWATASESNNKGFEVERSFDGKTFNQIDFVEGNETKETVSNYSFTDEDNDLSTATIVYYRLKQLDNNGNFSYSEIRAVESASAAPVINVFPNPAKAVLTVAVSGYTGNASLELTDISGKKLTLPTVDFNRESATQINISNCKPGIYLLKMITPEKTYTRKIAIQ